MEHGQFYPVCPPESERRALWTAVFHREHEAELNSARTYFVGTSPDGPITAAAKAADEALKEFVQRFDYAPPTTTPDTSIQ